MPEPTPIQITTDDGVAPAWIHRPATEGERPGVVFFPDAGSVRPVTHEMAARVAALGYVVLLPHIFYRAGDYPPFDFATVFTTPPERDRLMTLVRSLDAASAARDTRRYVAALRAEPGVRPGKLGCVGYCIGGRLAFLAAGSCPDDFGAAASVHGGGLATDAPDSPHLSAERVSAALYFGVADEDASATPEQQAALVSALGRAHVRFTFDHFRGKRHGFAVRDFPVYDEQAAETHWRRVEELFAGALG